MVNSFAHLFPLPLRMSSLSFIYKIQIGGILFTSLSPITVTKVDVEPTTPKRPVSPVLPTPLFGDKTNWAEAHIRQASRRQATPYPSSTARNLGCGHAVPNTASSD